jgi:hypothetical protein
MFESDFRKEIFDAIKWVYHQHFGVNLPIYGIPLKLKEYHTTKKDIANGNEIQPPDKYRIKGEDIYAEEARSRSGTESESVVSFGSIYEGS